MAYDIGADEYVSAGGPTQTDLSFDATAVAVLSRPLQAILASRSSAAAGVAIISYGNLFYKTADAVAVGIANRSYILVSLVRAGALAVGGAGVRSVVNVAESYAATAIGAPKATKAIVLAFAAQAAGISRQGWAIAWKHSAVAVGVPDANVARVQLKGPYAATGIGVAAASATFVPYTPPTEPSGDERAHDRTLLIRLGKPLVYA